MTENEAKRPKFAIVGGGRNAGRTLKAHIELLEELEAYRAIGTVEGYERAIKSSIENYNLYREYKAKVQAFEAIGTIEEFKALKEKNTPKKVAYQVEHEKCPTCGSFHVFGKHCTECGQAVDYD